MTGVRSATEADALWREKDKRRAIVDASSLRALAAIVESSGEPLADGYGSGVSSRTVQQEIERRLR